MAGTAALDELTPYIDIEDFFINIVEATESRLSTAQQLDQPQTLNLRP